MNITIMCKIVLLTHDQYLPGTRADWKALTNVFGRREFSMKDIPMLRAMHCASGTDKDRDSLYQAIADIVANLPEGGKLEVWSTD